MKTLHLPAIALATFLCGSFARAADTDPYAPYRADVAGLCRTVMADPAAGDSAAPTAGLCDCTVNGIVGVSDEAGALRFLKIWSAIAKLRDTMDPEDFASEKARAALDAVLAEIYPDGVDAGRAEMQAFTNRAMAVAEICVAGFKASGTAPPSFTPLDFLNGFNPK